MRRYFQLFTRMSVVTLSRNVFGAEKFVALSFFPTSHSLCCYHSIVEIIIVYGQMLQFNRHPSDDFFAEPIQGMFNDLSQRNRKLIVVINWTVRAN